MNGGVRDPERGAILALFSVALGLVLAVGAIVVDLGVFFEHRRQLQTKVDAAALAAGGRWVFPCEPDTDAAIVDTARMFFGSHVRADGSLYSGSALNAPVGGTSPADLHVVLNATQFWDDSPPEPTDFSDGSGAVCESRHLDVKATERDVNAFFGFLMPDVKAKARVEIRQVQGITGLLPIAVRVPEPESAAAVFVDESTGAVLDVSYLNKHDAPGPGLPTNLTLWTSFSAPVDGSLALGDPATFAMPTSNVGVLVATSFFPRCAGIGDPNCFEDEGFATANDLCRQGGGRVVQCFYATGSGASQTVQYGLALIRPYLDVEPGPTDPPSLEQAWLEPATCNYDGVFGAYFNAIAGSCEVVVAANVDVGGDRDGPGPFDPVDDVEVRLAGGDCNANFSGCSLSYVAGETWRTSGSDNPTVTQLSQGNGFRIRVRLRNTVVGGTDCTGSFGGPCEYVFGTSAAPVQRTFVGHDDSSGPIKTLRVLVDSTVPTDEIPDSGGEDATNTQPVGATRTFYVDVGLRTALASSESEPPYALNLKASQSATLDCDPAIPNLKSEVVAGCAPFYARNPLTLSPPCPTVSGINQFFTNPPPPFDTRWPPYECVITQTGNPRQLLDGFSERVLLAPNASQCPQDGPGFVPGRNYWQSTTNQSGDKYSFPAIRDDDRRLVTLFLTAYDSFTGTGNATYPIISFGTFYITGWGVGRPNGTVNVEDPCPGSTPPPDLIAESGGAYVWGHFITNVTPSNSGGSTDELCDPSKLVPCVAVLVE